MENKKENLEKADPFSLFVYTIRLQVTRDYYLKKLRIFSITFINFKSSKRSKEKCSYFDKITKVRTGNQFDNNILQFNLAHKKIIYYCI